MYDEENVDYTDEISDIYTTITNYVIILEQPLTRWSKNIEVVIEQSKRNNNISQELKTWTS